METKAEAKKVQSSTLPLTIDDVYERIKELIGEVETDPHKLLKEMRNARG